jgi:hypothetical protein
MLAGLKSLMNIPWAIGQAAELRRSGGPLRGTADDVVRRVFGGNRARFDAFVGELRRGLPAGTEVYLFGSAHTGRAFVSGKPFDARGTATSDMDVLLVGPDAHAAFLPAGKVRGGQATLPLSSAHPDIAPRLTALRSRLEALAGRPVSLSAMKPWYRRSFEIAYGLQMLRLV